MGYYFEDCRNVRLTKGTAVKRRPGLPMSATADASHFNQCSGKITLEDVHFEGQGDDGTNIHGMFHDVRAISSTGTGAGARLTLGGRPAGGNPPLFVGGIYEFRNRSTWLIEGRGTLVGWTVDKSTGQQVADFAFQPPVLNVSMFALLAEVTRMPAVHISNAFFGNNRARGALIKTSNVLVENSVFDHNSGPCLQVRDGGVRCWWVYVWWWWWWWWCVGKVGAG